MNDERPSSKAEGLAKIEGWQAEADERARRQEESHREALLEVLTDIGVTGLAPVSAAVAAQVELIGDRLLELDLVDPDKDDIGLKTINDLTTGESVVGIEVNGLLYAASPMNGKNVLVARRERGNRREYAVVDDKGKFGPWQPASPPGAQKARNN
ncbi:MAG: hypothetical protein ACRDLL_14350 [Solirubrobacterales bacterium]